MLEVHAPQCTGSQDALPVACGEGVRNSCADLRQPVRSVPLRRCAVLSCFELYRRPGVEQAREYLDSLEDVPQAALEYTEFARRTRDVDSTELEKSPCRRRRRTSSLRRRSYVREPPRDAALTTSLDHLGVPLLVGEKRCQALRIDGAVALGQDTPLHVAALRVHGVGQCLPTLQTAPRVVFAA